MKEMNLRFAFMNKVHAQNLKKPQTAQYLKKDILQTFSNLF